MTLLTSYAKLSQLRRIINELIKSRPPVFYCQNCNKFTHYRHETCNGIKDYTTFNNSKISGRPKVIEIKTWKSLESVIKYRNKLKK